MLSYTWAPPTRYQRIVEMLTTGQKLDVDDFVRMQQDVISLPARDFQSVLKGWHPGASTEAAHIRSELLNWNASVDMSSKAALLYEVWIEHLHRALLPKGIASVRLAPDILMNELKASPQKNVLLETTLETSLTEIRKRLGADDKEWTWGNLHKAYFRHPLGVAPLNLPPHSRPGDAYTVNATGGPNYSQTHGASYREILDAGNWDRSIMTNVPGESGVPGNAHYGDLIEGWADGHYHPLPYSRQAVEAAAEERLLLAPAGK